LVISYHYTTASHYPQDETSRRALKEPETARVRPENRLNRLTHEVVSGETNADTGPSRDLCVIQSQSIALAVGYRIHFANMKIKTEGSKRSTRNVRRAMLQAAALTLFGTEVVSAQATGSWSPKKESAGGPIRSGHLLFLSGIGGWYPERRAKPGDIKEQTADALQIMKESLAKAGSSMENVLKVQVALVDPEKNWEPMNEVYNTFFPKDRPARSYFGSTGFRRSGQLLQVDCTAYVE
jgi:enamine deaminase RidA (YjgF/YER057c/UK114 family)